MKNKPPSLPLLKNIPPLPLLKVFLGQAKQSVPLLKKPGLQGGHSTFSVNSGNLTELELVELQILGSIHR